MNYSSDNGVLHVTGALAAAPDMIVSDRADNRLIIGDFPTA